MYTTVKRRILRLRFVYVAPLHWSGIYMYMCKYIYMHVYVYHCETAHFAFALSIRSASALERSHLLHFYSRFVICII